MGGLGGGPGGVQGAGHTSRFFFDFLAFQNRAQGSGRVGRGDNFSHPPGTRRRGQTRSKFPKFLG